MGTEPKTPAEQGQSSYQATRPRLCVDRPNPTTGSQSIGNPFELWREGPKLSIKGRIHLGTWELTPKHQLRKDGRVIKQQDQDYVWIDRILPLGAKALKIPVNFGEKDPKSVFRDVFTSLADTLHVGISCDRQNSCLFITCSLVITQECSTLVPVGLFDNLNSVVHKRLFCKELF